MGAALQPDDIVVVGPAKGHTMFHESDDEVFSIEPDDLTVPMDSSDPEFLRGVEVGYMMMLGYYGFPAHMKVHTSNSEMIMRIADAYDLSFSAEDTDDNDVVVLTLVPPEGDGEDDEDDD